MELRGIDVSEHNGVINWNQVTGFVDFVIIRAGYGRLVSQEDKSFETNYANAKSRNIKVGAYWYSYAMDPDEAKLEAKACLEVLGNKAFDYPIYYDIEESKQIALGKDKVRAIIDTFCTELEKHNYWVGVYSGAANLKMLELGNRYAQWVAHWDVAKPDCTNYGLWQYKVGTCPGVNGNCDLDYAYIDYPSKMGAHNNNKLSKFEFPIEIKIGDEVYIGTVTKK